MIHSMTAFARQEIQANWGVGVWEIRSVNHRYLEISVRLPEVLNSLEPLIREKIKSQLQRGKVEINLRYKPLGMNTQQIILNEPLINQLIQASNAIIKLTKETAPINPIDILRWPGTLSTPEENLQQIQADLLTSFASALNDLIAARAREGKAIQQLLFEALAAMQIEINKVRQQLPVILNLQREKLIHQFHEAELKLDTSRFEQEIVFFAQKIDIKEEIDRLETHIKEVQRILHQPGGNGRRLDFLMQELNREANTMGSKSVTSETTLAAVELKVLIEQMREQVQNIE